MTSVGGFRLVATDLDGTALRSWSTFLAATGQDPTAGGVDESERTSPRLRAAVAEVRRRGVPVVVATGRSRRTAVAHATALGADHLICSNGALVWDLAGAAVLRHVGIPVVAAAAVAERLAAIAPAASHVWESAEARGLSPTFRDHMPPSTTAYADALVASIAERAATHPEDRIVKLAVRLAPDASEHAELVATRWDELQAAVGEDALATTAGAHLLEIGPAGTTKAVALAELAGELGVPAPQVIAFGDERNDVPMLSWAGRGVAMGDAPDDVRAVADEVTGTADEDGVAVVLERLLGA